MGTKCHVGCGIIACLGHTSGIPTVPLLHHIDEVCVHTAMYCLFSNNAGFRCFYPGPTKTAGFICPCLYQAYLGMSSLLLMSEAKRSDLLRPT